MKIFYRILFYLLGLFFLAVGSIFSINSNLGVSPVNALPYAISIVSGVNLGMCVTGIFSLYVVIQAILFPREFRVKTLLQIVFTIIFGYFVNFIKSTLGAFAIPTYLGQLLMIAIGISFVAIGLTFYLGANIVPMPMEGMTMAVTKKLKRFPFHNVKIAIDCISVLLAAVICLIGIGSVEGLREGTVIAALVTGKVLAVCSRFIRPKIEAVWY